MKKRHRLIVLLVIFLLVGMGQIAYAEEKKMFQTLYL